MHFLSLFALLWSTQVWADSHLSISRNLGTNALRGRSTISVYCHGSGAKENCMLQSSRPRQKKISHKIKPSLAHKIISDFYQQTSLLKLEQAVAGVGDWSVLWDSKELKGVLSAEPNQKRSVAAVFSAESKLRSALP